MDFKTLEYFVTLAESKNITSAAKVLGLTQPTLSIYLHTLEEKVGTRLFERVGKTLILTYAGERYLHYAKEILLSEKEMMRELAELQSEDSGSLGLTCMLARSTFLIPETIPLFKQQHPGISVQLSEEISYEALEKNILEGTSSLGIANYTSGDPHITSQLLGTEELLLVTNTAHPIAKEFSHSHFNRYPVVDLKSLKGTSFIISKNTRTAQLAHHLLSKSIGSDYNLFIETRNIETALRLTSEGLGITFLCNIHAQFPYLPKNLVFFSINDPDTKIPLNVLYRTNGYLPTYVQDYLDLLHKYANDEIYS